jgi:hypothetical protein
MNLHPQDVLTVAVVAWFGSRLIVSFQRSIAPVARRRAAFFLRGLRLRHFLPVPALLAAVATTAYALVQLPVLSFGWWTALGGRGNPAFGITERTEGTWVGLVVPLVFIVLLTPALPLLVEREEMLFRAGAETWPWWKRLGKGALLFGLAHAAVGVPIGVALALSIGGAWFLRAYLRGYRGGGRGPAVAESTRAHLAYNLTIITIVALALLADLLSRVWRYG